MCDPNCGLIPFTEFKAKSTLDHFNDGRQGAMLFVIKVIEEGHDIEALERMCRSYLETVLAHGRETVPA